MRVFISWSGPQSRLVASELRKWLPNVLQFVDPYFSPDDIEKGSRWSSDIAEQLDTTDVGIICVTKSNVSSQWLMFEAGAISKRVGQSKVCPILIGLQASDVSGPLTQFQASSTNRNDVFRLVESINQEGGDRALGERALDAAFDMWWPALEGLIRDAEAQYRDSPGAKIRSSDDVLAEILGLSRRIARSGGESADAPAGGNPAYATHEFRMALGDLVGAIDLVFDHDWDFTKSALEGIDSFVSADGTFLEPNVADERDNWGNRGGLLDAYREVNAFIREHDFDLVEPWWREPQSK